MTGNVSVKEASRILLDYIGIPWKDPEHWWLNVEIEGQMNIFDYMTNDGILIEMENEE